MNNKQKLKLAKDIVKAERDLKKCYKDALGLDNLSGIFIHPKNTMFDLTPEEFDQIKKDLGIK